MTKHPESSNPGAADPVSAKSNGSPAASDPRGESRETARASPASAGAASTTPQPHVPTQRKGQFLIATRRTAGMQPFGLQPLQFSMVEQTLRSSPDIDVIDTVGPKNIMGALAAGMEEAPSVLVARMTDQKANNLYQQAQGRLIVERDHSLTLADAAFQKPTLVACSLPSDGAALNTAFTVLGKDNAPLPDAEVYLFGSMLPAGGVTDGTGQVQLTLYGETAQTVRGLYVKPKADHWSFYQQDPDVSLDQPNVVTVRPLSDWPALANFPQQQAFGWGQKAMRLHQLPNNYRGQGIKVAVIDSGAATTHEDLKQIRFGFDVINKKVDASTWTQDTLSHGSHCAGIIGGADDAAGIRGFAPDAEIHACKLFPGGQVSQLIDALEYCIEKEIDVVNLSLGGAERSEALEQQILRAKQAGIACIVAAGNTGAAVQYPASSPNVLAVAAIGKINEFPQTSYHTQTLTPQIDANGFFSPKFTCFGPEIAVCAPGVAITSSVPPNNFAVWDGTSMAAPHVSGVAALIMAHHPDFRGAFKARGPERVERLFQIIKACSSPINLGDPNRTGFGLPDVLVAVGLQAPMGQALGMGRQAFYPGQQAAMSVPGGVQQPAMRTEMFATAALNPLQAAYLEQAAQAQQLLQPQWSSAYWPQVGQSFGFGGQSGYRSDPGSAGYPGGAPGGAASPSHGPLGFAYAPGQAAFGRPGW